MTRIKVGVSILPLNGWVKVHPRVVRGRNSIRLKIDCWLKFGSAAHYYPLINNRFYILNCLSGLEKELAAFKRFSVDFLN